MATTELPSNLTFCTIVGCLVLAVGDTSNDVDHHPDSTPAVGTVTFTPQPPVVTDQTATPPVMIVPKPIVITLDGNGFIVDGTGNPGVQLVATDNAAGNPVNWTYTVSFAIAGAQIQPFSMAAPGNTTIDLSTVVPVQPSQGETLAVAEAAAASAATSAAAAAVSAAEAEAAVGQDTTSDWAPSTVYVLHQLIVHSGILYRANVAHTSGSTFDPTKWDSLGSGGGDLVTSVFGRTGDITGASTDLTDHTATGVALFTAANAAGARSTLGLGTAATQPSTAFDAAGAAATAQATAQGSSAQKSANLSDLGSPSAALTNLGGVAASGNIASATKLQTARTINGVAFDGTGNIVTPACVDDWAATTAYLTHQLAVHSGSLLRRNSAGTSRATFDSTEAALWTAVGGSTVDYTTVPAGSAFRFNVASPTAVPFTRTDLSVTWVGGSSAPPLVTSRTLGAVEMLERNDSASPPIAGDSWDATP